MNNDLFNENVNLVYKIVHRMNYGYCDIDDLIQVGLMGLYQATLNFDSTKGVNFSTYAIHYIVGEVKKEMRNTKKIKLSREIYKIIKKIKTFNLEGSVELLCEDLGVSKEKLLLALLHYDNILSLNNNYENIELIDTVVDDKYHFNYDIMHELDKPQQGIITLKYYKGYTQKQIGKILHLSQSKISRLENQALMVLRNSL